MALYVNVPLGIPIINQSSFLSFFQVHFLAQRVFVKINSFNNVKTKIRQQDLNMILDS